MQTPSTPSFDGRGLVVPTKDHNPLSSLYARYLAETCRAFLSQNGRLPPALRGPHRKVAAVVSKVAAKSPRAMLSCFASPTVGSAMQCLGLRDDLPTFRDSIDEAVAKMMPHLLLEMALRRLIPEGESVEWTEPVGKLQSLTINSSVVAPPDGTKLRFASGLLTSSSADGATKELRLEPAILDAVRKDPEAGGFRLEPAYLRIGQVTRLALVDHNPIAQFEAHPDKEGNAMDLGERPPEEWVDVLEQAFRLIEVYTPELYTEMGSMLHEVVPVGYHPEKHLSASYREAIGTVYMTLHPNLMTMTEAVIHEFQHNKANVAAYSAEYLNNAFYPLFKSPVRPDPRPLWGILLAVHAFLPVALLYRRMRDGGHPRAKRPDFEQRMADIDLKNHEGMEMLRAYADWTVPGKAFFDDLDELDRAHMSERLAKGLTTAPVSAHVG
jgi:HEXXH motif-containing protein